MMRRKLRNRGITLIEALATISVLAILLPVAMHALSNLTRTSGVARDSSRATTLAESKLGELLGSGNYLNTTGQGDFGDDAPGFVWTSEINSTTEQGISELRLSVIWEDNGGKRNVAVSTLVYDPNAVASSTSASGGTP